MSKYNIAAVVVVSLLVFLVAAIPPLTGPMIFLTLALATVAVYRLGNILVNGFNEHTRAMQAFYEELHGRSAKSRSD